MSRFRILHEGDFCINCTFQNNNFQLYRKQNLKNGKIATSSFDVAVFYGKR